MLGTGIYPITIAEMPTYSADADRIFEGDEQEKLKEFLAVHPENGEIILGTNGVRRIIWPISDQDHRKDTQVIYYFRDLNMPLYMLAISEDGEFADVDDEWREEVSQLVEVLVQEHGKIWRNAIRIDNNIA